LHTSNLQFIIDYVVKKHLGFHNLKKKHSYKLTKT